MAILQYICLFTNGELEAWLPVKMVFDPLGPPLALGFLFLIYNKSSFIYNSCPFSLFKKMTVDFSIRVRIHGAFYFRKVLGFHT